MVISLLIGLSVVEAVNRQTRKLDPKRKKKDKKNKRKLRL